MTIELRSDPRPQASDWLVGGGGAGKLIRATDWSQTSLGPIETWPQSLRSAVSILLPSKAQIILFWGPDLIALYNDAYVPVLGAKHPRALGLPAREVWSELWEVGLRGLFEGVLATGEAFWARDRPFFMDRFGFKEETYFDVSYDPVRDESGQVGGLFCIVSETTERVLGERRLRTLRDLSASTAACASSVDDECRAIAAILDRNRHDVAFTLLYLLDEGGGARLVGTSGLVPGTPAAPIHVDLADTERGAAAWPLGEVLGANRAQVVADLSRFGDVPSGAWPESAHTAVVLPVGGAGTERPIGFLVAGVSPRRLLDDAYRAFFDLLAGHVATSLANARAYEQERRRAEALAELDRAKTTFFSNVSHEFRTPLTLMLGPVEDLLSRGDADLSASTRTQLEVVSRNGTRLLRLVNALLEFSRIEAGRVRADYRPTDLAALTAGLAAVFRSACERAGLSLVVDCRQLSEPVFVDRDMWEKVVLNLVSNAFKFTFTGGIAVEVRQAGSAAQLEVRDTGTGVPAEEMPRLFERFHRIDNARGRTHEGSGIGLALVQELVRLHGGSIVARSEVDRGTTFVVSIPFGTAHLPADQVSSGRAGSIAGTGAAPYVEEALRWLPEEESSGVPLRDESQSADRSEPDSARHDGRPTVLVADDNVDMRQYVRRLLAERFHVIAVADGEAALASARGGRPDLVLTDVMMPRLDGFGLLRELRAGAATRDVPVIMLSARAGEESRVEGMQAGADDYLIKPFGARELLARVEALIKLARLRREAAETLRTSEERSRLAQSVARVGTFEWNVRTREVTWTPELEAIFGLKPGAFGGTHADFERLVHPDDRSGVVAAADEAIRSGEPTEHEFRIVRPDGGARWIAGRFQCFKDAHGEPLRVSGVNIDVTERKLTEEALRRSERELADFFDNATVGLHWVGPDGTILRVNRAELRLLGYSEEEYLGHDIAEFHADRNVIADILRRLAAGEELHDCEARMICKDGSVKHVLVDSSVLWEDGRFVHTRCFTRDVTEQVRAEEIRLRLAAIVESTDDSVLSVDAAGAITSWNRGAERLYGYAAEEVTGKSISLLIPPDHMDDLPTVMDRLGRGERLERCETVRLTKDGRLVDVSLTISPIRNARGEVVGASKIARDISERKRTEEALRESRRHLAAELSATTRLHALSGRLLAAGDLVAALDDVLENAIATCGADFGNIQTLDRRTRVLEIAVHRGFHEEFLDHFRTVQVDDGSACARAMGGGEPIMIEDVELDPAFEPHRNVATSAGFRAVHSTPLKTHDGTIVGMLSTHFRDPHRVSERDRRLLDLYARHAADLIERVRSEEALKAADRRKDEFLATLAHELRNPLAPLRNGLELMTIAPDATAMHQDAREMMRRQLDHMVRLVDDLLDLSRIRRDKLQLRKGRFHLRHLLDCALETSRPLLEAGKHCVSVQCPSEPIVLDADATRITQVFANLLNNAAKFTPSGGRVDVEVRADNGDAVVEVRDSGVGIDADMIERVFDMFAQAETVAGEGKGGLGIGLTLAKRLSEMHGGSIRVASAGLGKGCTFTVRLPRLRSESEAHVASVRRGPPTTVPQSVLVADDNVDAATSLAMLLRMSGHDVRVANDGEQALHAVKTFLPTVVILDLGMPRVNGYDAARQIRESAGARCPLLVAVTGWGQESDRRRTKDAGFDLHFVKPIDFTELNAALQRRSG